MAYKTIAASDAGTQTISVTLETSPASAHPLVITRRVEGCEWRNWLLLAALTGAYLAALAYFSPMPLQDLPTHLARAVVMDDLIFHGGAHFSSLYRYEFAFIPYVLGDLLFACSVEVLGPTAASIMWTWAVFLALPCSLLFYMKVAGLTRRGRPLVCLLALYLATDWTFAMGFLSFRLGTAMTLATLGFAQALRNRCSPILFAAYSTAVISCYLMHLSTILFLSTALSVTGLMRALKNRLMPRRVEYLLALPLIALVLWNSLASGHYRAVGDLVENSYTWGAPIVRKVTHLGILFFRYGNTGDIELLGAFIACLALLLFSANPKQLGSHKVRELFAQAIAFAVLYFALPSSYSDAMYVDVRALPLATVFLVLTLVQLADTGPAVKLGVKSLPLPLAALVAVGNLVSLSTVWREENARLTSYRDIVGLIPTGARVLPVHTGDRRSHVYPQLHAGSFITIDRFGLNPYEFTGDNGNPQKYFRFIDVPIAPEETWYGSKSHMALKTQSLGCAYEYLMVMQPFSPDQITVPTTPVAGNATVSLLAVDKRRCQVGGAARSVLDKTDK